MGFSRGPITKDGGCFQVQTLLESKTMQVNNSGNLKAVSDVDLLESIHVTLLVLFSFAHADY